MPRLSAIISLAFLAIALPLQAGGKKPPPMKVSFHLQGDASEGVKRVFPQSTAGQELFFRLSPEITQKDILAFRPFPADDESTYGMVFQLKGQVAKRLRHICNANRGRYLLAMVNGQVRDAVLIDKASEDPYIVIWQRLGPKEVRTADLIMPRIGMDPKKWKKNRKK